MVAPAHQLFDSFCRDPDLFGVMVFVRQHLLFRQHDGNRRNAFAPVVADRRGNAGDGVIGFGDLYRQPVMESGACRLRQGLRVDFRAASGRGAGAALEQFDTLRLRQMTDEQAAGGRPVQGNTGADARRDLKMAWTIGHGQNKHMVAIAAAKLHGLARMAAQIVHFVGGDTHEIQRAGIGKAIMVKPRAEPDIAIGIACQHVLFDEIVNDHIDGGKWRLDRLGNRVSAGWRSGFVKVINNLKRTVDAADARALGRLRVRIFLRGRHGG